MDETVRERPALSRPFKRRTLVELSQVTDGTLYHGGPLIMTEAQEHPLSLPPRNIPLSPVTTEDRRSLIELLEFEIGRIITEDRQPGWTSWALLGALSAILWAMSGLLPLSSLNTDHVVLVFLGSSSLVDALMVIRSLLTRQPEATGAATVRFRLTSKSLWDSRVTMLWGAARAVLLILLISYHRDLLGLRVTLLSCAYSGVIALFSVLFLLMTYVPIPVRASPVPASRRANIFRITMLLLCQIVAVLLVMQVARIGAALAGAELRFGLLMTAFVYVCLPLTYGPREYQLRAILVEVRRDLVLGSLDIDTARRQVLLALKGMETSDLLQDPLNQVLEALRDVAARNAAMSRTAEELLAQHDMITAFTKDDELRAYAALQLLEVQSAAASDALNDSATAIRQIQMTSIMMAKVAGRNARATPSLIELLEAELAQATASLDQARRSILCLHESLDRRNTQEPESSSNDSR
jgi:hypothetical protein